MSVFSQPDAASGGGRGSFGFGAAIINQTGAEVGVLADASGRKSSNEVSDTPIEPDRDALAAMSDKERIERIRESVERHPRHREILYRIMAYVKDNAPATYQATESYVADLPQFKSSLQSERILISILERAGALESDGSDAGNLTLTEPGKSFEASFTPDARLRDLMEGSDPDQVDAYKTILAECDGTKRTFEYLNEKLSTHEAVRIKSNGQMAIYPSTYIDRLEKAAGLLWDEGWIATDEGLAYA